MLLNEKVIGAIGGSGDEDVEVLESALENVISNM
ncbi:hypothetical protein [Salinibacillus xinjiangensis]